MSGSLTFKDDLWDSFETVCGRLKEASIFEQGFHTLMSNYAKETREYARKILALAKTKEDEELYTLNQGWLGAKQEMDKLANLFLKMADDITYKVAQPVENHFKETQKIKRKGKESGRKLIADLTESIKVLSAAKSDYERLMRVYDQSKADHERASNLNELYNSTKVKKRLEADKKKAEAAEKKYRKAVEKHQQLEVKLFDTDMPQLMNEFEETERSRVETIRSSLEAFSRSYLDLIPSLEGVCKNIDSHVHSIDAVGDVNQFILDKRTGKDKKDQRTEFEPYNPQFKSCVREGQTPASSPAPQTRQEHAPSVNPLTPQGSSSNVLAAAGTDRNSGRFASPLAQASQPSVAQPSAASNYGSGNYGSGNNYGSGTAMPVQAQAPVQAQQAPQPQQPTAAHASQPANPSAQPAVPVIAYCRGLHDYNAGQPSELSFKKGDIIKVMEKDPSGWWAGEVDGRMGFFPSVDWVEEIEQPPPVSRAARPVSQHIPASYQSQSQQPQAYAQQAQQQYQAPAPTQQPQAYAPPPAAASSLRRCKALFPMDAQNANELSLRAGDIITIEKEADGWFLGTNARGERGIFPASFVALE